MYPDVIPLISAVHVHTMCTPWGTHVPWHHLLTLTPSRLFPILLDPKSFQTALDYSTWLPGHVLLFRCRLIIYYLIYVRLTLTLAKVCPHSRSITLYRVLLCYLIQELLLDLTLWVLNHNNTSICNWLLFDTSYLIQIDEVWSNRVNLKFIT